MDIFIVSENQSLGTMFNAGSKARNDIEDIAVSSGCIRKECYYDELEKRMSSGHLSRVMAHLKVKTFWSEQLKDCPPKSVIIFQFPLKAHSVLFAEVLKTLKEKSIKTIAIIHDLEYLRNSIISKAHVIKNARYRVEELSTLKLFDHIIVHNSAMKEYMSSIFDIPSQKMTSIRVFDYLIPDYYETNNIAPSTQYSVIIAGNLDKKKSGYVYNLPNDVDFKLYGANYLGQDRTNVLYKGVFTPDVLPFKLRGSFGLVWDGPDVDTCSGIYGEYLKYNNPHKTSLYLASGIPCIVWKESAISHFIRDNNCGIAINSINELASVLRKTTYEEYRMMKDNATFIGKQLRAGYYFREALKDSIDCIGI